ncbi:ArsC/Spx/MgsR family protein [Oceanobacter mangrovi]|uniref:ArsC/Spx/MgsR family protein n=1 Tax=Oceanobacter mangrovi TaxID=2862510 RepID=UPI001C8DB0C7|nr:ArsC/Spx/MgsR family protein [Oceanobacter mangrovi]
MEKVMFFGKPGCKTNRRQRAILRDSGVELQEFDLLTTSWTPSKLKPYLKGLDVADWFNRAAPAVRDGAIDVESLSPADALNLLCLQPILIHRPLLRSGSWYSCGFDRQQLETVLGVELANPDGEPDEGCRHPLHGTTSGGQGQCGSSAARKQTEMEESL